MNINQDTRVILLLQNYSPSQHYNWYCQKPHVYVDYLICLFIYIITISLLLLMILFYGLIASKVLHNWTSQFHPLTKIYIGYTCFLPYSIPPPCKNNSVCLSYRNEDIYFCRKTSLSCLFVLGKVIWQRNSWWRISRTNRSHEEKTKT